MTHGDLPGHIRPSWRRSLRAGLLSVLLLLAPAAGAQQFLHWDAPAGSTVRQNDAALVGLARQLLEGSDADHLTPVQRSQSLLVAGQHAQAYAAITDLMQSLRSEGNESQAQRWTPYLLMAQAGNPAEHGFDRAYAAAFAARFAALDDVSALKTHYWFTTNLPAAQAKLDAALAGHAGSADLTREQALDLIRQAAFIETFRVAALLAPALIRADEDRRFEIDDAVRIPAAEGVVLSAHVARPRKAAAPPPAAMLFTIYTDPARNRTQAALAAAHGYVGVVVDARGKRLGTGTAAPYETEGVDAAAGVDWISRQPWTDGRVVMYGGSYSGFAAWAAAKHAPPALKAIAPYVAAIPGLGLPMENNVFLSANYAWPFYVANNRLLDNDTYNQRERWDALTKRWYVSGRPYRQIDQVDGTSNPWLQRWLAHPDYDAYWQAMVPYGDDFTRICIPVLSITGYYDDGQISALQYFREHIRHMPDADHRLLIGPYDHFGTQANVKAMELRGYSVDPVAQFDTDAITFQWFDHVLHGAPLPALLADRVNYQLMGANRWKHAPSLQAAGGGMTTFHLSSERADTGYRLIQTAAPPAGVLTQTVDFADRSHSRHNYYPWPVLRDGPSDDGGLSFVSAPFDQPMDMVGPFTGDLKIRINKRDVDLTVTLYEWQKDGKVMQLSYYVGRASYAADMTTRHLLTPGQWTHVPLQRTRMTGRRLAEGSRLLVVVDVLKDAEHQVNHGTGKDVSDESVADAGEPLRIEWSAESELHVPLRAAGAE